MRRYALVTGSPLTARAVGAYLPGNYRFEGILVERSEGPETSYLARHEPMLSVNERLVAVVSGVDDAGWTLEDYVRPRLQSGCYGCQEIDLSHPAMKAIPS